MVVKLAVMLGHYATVKNWNPMYGLQLSQLIGSSYMLVLSWDLKRALIENDVGARYVLAPVILVPRPSCMEYNRPFPSTRNCIVKGTTY